MTELSYAVQPVFISVLFNQEITGRSKGPTMEGVLKVKIIVISALAAVLLTGCVSIRVDGREHHRRECEKYEKCEKCGEAEHYRWHAHQAWRMKKARVSKKTAEHTALARVPHGTVKAAALGKEHGKVQWSFDIATPNSKEITEVNVDAMNGKVISVSKESTAHEAREGGRDNDHQ